MLEGVDGTLSACRTELCSDGQAGGLSYQFRQNPRGHQFAAFAGLACRTYARGATRLAGAGGQQTGSLAEQFRRQAMPSTNGHANQRRERNWLPKSNKGYFTVERHWQND